MGNGLPKIQIFKGPQRSNQDARAESLASRWNIVRTFRNTLTPWDPKTSSRGYCQETTFSSSTVCRHLLIIVQKDYVHGPVQDVEGGAANFLLGMHHLAASDARKVQLSWCFLINQTSDSLLKKIAEFCLTVKAGDEVFLYYVGHGTSIWTSACLVSVDNQKRGCSVHIDDVLSQIFQRGPRFTCIVLDALNSYDVRTRNVLSRAVGLNSSFSIVGDKPVPPLVEYAAVKGGSFLTASTWWQQACIEDISAKLSAAPSYTNRRSPAPFFLTAPSFHSTRVACGRHFCATCIIVASLKEAAILFDHPLLCGHWRETTNEDDDLSDDEVTEHVALEIAARRPTVLGSSWVSVSPDLVRRSLSPPGSLKAQCSKSNGLAGYSADQKNAADSVDVACATFLSSSDTTAYVSHNKNCSVEGIAQHKGSSKNPTSFLPCSIAKGSASLTRRPPMVCVRSLKQRTSPPLPSVPSSSRASMEYQEESRRNGCSPPSSGCSSETSSVNFEKTAQAVVRFLCDTVNVKVSETDIRSSKSDCIASLYFPAYARYANGIVTPSSFLSAVLLKCCQCQYRDQRYFTVDLLLDRLEKIALHSAGYQVPWTYRNFSNFCLHVGSDKKCNGLLLEQ